MTPSVRMIIDLRPSLADVTVADGIVELWGMVDSSAEKEALRLVVEGTPGV